MAKRKKKISKYKTLWTKIKEIFSGREAPEKIKNILLGSRSLTQEATIIKARKLKQLGFSDIEISEKLGLGLAEIKKAISRPGSSGRPRQKTRNRLLALDTWQTLHPEIQLPESVREVSVITGIPLSTVYRCLHYRQARFQNWVTQLGEIKNPKLFFETIDGKRIFWKACKEFSWFYNPISNKAVLEIKTFLGDIFIVPIQDRRLFAHAWKGLGAFAEEGAEDQNE